MAVPHASEPTFRLMYRSHDRIDPADRKRVLGSLFTEARANNKALGITGALLVSEGWFVQVLEGTEAPVRALYEHIATDPRHDEVSLLEAGPVTGRVFSRWAMAEVSADGGADVPLIAHADGIAPAAGHRTTAEQSAVLATMRRAARVGADPQPTS